MRAELSPDQQLEALNEVNRGAIVAARDNETVEEREERRRLDAEANRRGLHVKLKLRRRGRSFS